MMICVPYSRCNLTLTAWLEISDTPLIPEIILVLEERRKGLGPNLSTRDRRSTTSRNEFLSRWQLAARPLDRPNDHAVFSSNFERVVKEI